MAGHFSSKSQGEHLNLGVGNEDNGSRKKEEGRETNYILNVRAVVTLSELMLIFSLPSIIYIKIQFHF